MNELKNRVQLMGYLGNDPDVKQFKSGKTITTASIATNERYKNQEGEWVTDTQWHKIVGWNSIGKRMEKKLKKGTEILVSGKLVYRNYEDKEGVKKTFTEINVDSMEILSNAVENTEATTA